MEREKLITEMYRAVWEWEREWEWEWEWDEE